MKSWVWGLGFDLGGFIVVVVAAAVASVAESGEKGKWEVKKGERREKSPVEAMPEVTFGEPVSVARGWGCVCQHGQLRPCSLSAAPLLDSYFQRAASAAQGGGRRSVRAALEPPAPRPRWAGTRASCGARSAAVRGSAGTRAGPRCAAGPAGGTGFGTGLGWGVRETPLTLLRLRKAKGGSKCLEMFRVMPHLGTVGAPGERGGELEEVWGGAEVLLLGGEGRVPLGHRRQCSACLLRGMQLVLPVGYRWQMPWK